MGSVGLMFQVLEDEWSWEEVPLAEDPTKTEWKRVRVIKKLEILSAGPAGPVLSPIWPNPAITLAGDPS